MKKLFSIIMIIFLIMTYNSQKKPVLPKPIADPKVIYNLACGDSGVRLKKTDNWYNNKNLATIERYNFKNSKSLEKVRQEYSFKDGFLYYNKKKVDSLQIYYRSNEEIDLVLNIFNGKPTSYVINVNNNPRPSMYSVLYSKKGINYRFIEQDIFIPNGTGILKNYYYGEWDGQNQKFSKEILKEEGEVRNNFKFGKWKYYNKIGKKDSTKNYTLKDSVDVRFPHCIFNKNEPCY